LQLGADAVGAADQDRVLEAGGLEVEERAEAAEPAHGAGAVGGARQRLDGLDQRVAGIDVDPGVLVGQAVFAPARAGSGSVLVRHGLSRLAMVATRIGDSPVPVNLRTGRHWPAAL